MAYKPRRRRAAPARSYSRPRSSARRAPARRSRGRSTGRRTPQTVRIVLETSGGSNSIADAASAARVPKNVGRARF